MKKILPFLLLLLMAATICHAADSAPRLIYVNQLFDNQEVGDDPNSFVWFQYGDSLYREHIQAAKDSAEVIKIEKDGNPENKAVKFSAYTNPDDKYTAMARSVINELPIQKKGVISFSFMVNDFKGDKQSFINTNVTDGRHITYIENKSYFDFITIKSDDVYWRGNTLIKNDIKVNQWYRVDLAFDVQSGSASLYFDGNATDVTLPSGTVNISEIMFHMPTAEGSSWCVDELRIYEADGLLSDEVVNADWNRYATSPFYAGPEYEMGRATIYDHLAFLSVYGKTFAAIDVNKLYVNNEIVQMPAPVYREEKKIMIPIRAIAESFGAKVSYDAALGRIKVDYNGKIMEVTPGEYIYYIDSKPAKLYYPVALKNDTACIQIDVLLNFLGKSYVEKNNILWFDEPPKYQWKMPEGVSSFVYPLDEHINYRIMLMLLFDRPSRTELAEKIKPRGEGDALPRLYVDDFSQLRYAIENEPQLKVIADNFIRDAKKYLDEPDFEGGTRDGMRSSYAANVQYYFMAWSFAYRFSDEPESEREKYKNRMWEQIELLNSFEDEFTFSTHPLSTGEMAYGLSMAYDWLYDVWTPEQRAIIENMCKRNIFDNALHAYNTTVYNNGRQIGYMAGNQCIIINGGFLSLALAMYESDPEYYTDVILGAMRACERGFYDFYPNGEWEEGVSYWQFTMGYFPYVVKNIQLTFGEDFGITDVPGVLKTGTFPINMSGATGAYVFGDGQSSAAVSDAAMMFQAEQTGDKALAQYRKENFGSGTFIDLLCWVYDTSEYGGGLQNFDDDMYSETNSTVILKTGWDRSDTSVSLHGGANNDPHGHLDSGSFQMDIMGVRLGMQLPREDYNLRDIGHYDIKRVSEFYPEGYSYTGGHYYRSKGEGHNCVVANRQETNAKLPSDPNSYDMKTTGKTEFIKMEFGETSSFALLNITDTNDVFDCAIRGVRLDKLNNVVEIQDDIRADKETDFLWSMHTYATIDVSEDGKTAILEQGGAKVKASILTDGDEKFEVLPAEFLEDYGTSAKPKFESPNFLYDTTHEYYLTHGVACGVKGDVRKLAIRTVTDHLKLSIAFEPYVEGNTFVPEYVSLDKWKITSGEREELSSVFVDGKKFENLSSGIYNYSINVLTQESDIPEISAEAKDVDIKVIQAKSLPGTSSVVLSKDGETVGLYNFIITPLNNTDKFHSEKQLPIYSYSVTSEPQADNPAVSLFDGDFGTKFATDEQGGSVTIDLGSVIEGDLKLNIACLNGDRRKENFKIEYSEDGLNYIEAFNGSNSGTTTEFEQFDIAKKARYVRVSFYGSSQGVWVSVTEMFVSKE